MTEPDVVERLDRMIGTLDHQLEAGLVAALRDAADEITRLRSQVAAMREALKYASHDLDLAADALRTNKAFGTASLVRICADKARAALASTEAAGEETR